MIDNKRIRNVRVTLDNGHVWRCSVDNDGRLHFESPVVGNMDDKEKLNKAVKEGKDPKKVKSETKMPKMFEPTKGEPDGEHKDVKDSGMGLPEGVEPPISDNVFRERLSSIMTDNMFDRRIRGSKRGSLDMLRLWKAKAGAKNVFQRKQERKNKNYNIVLLVDESGSMGGSRIEVASEIAVFLAKSFEGLNLNLAIVGFNRIIHLHKDFNEPIKDYKQLQTTIIDNVNKTPAGYNHDFDAISKAFKMFKGKEGHNLLFMISDGAPATDTYILREVERKGLEQVKKDFPRDVVYKDHMGKTHEFWYDKDYDSKHNRNGKDEIKALVNKNKGVADMFGVGIDSECWQAPDHIRVDNLEELKPAILKRIKAKIRRG